MEILKGFIYFENNGKIEVLRVPRFGSVVIKSQNGEIVSSENTEQKQYYKK
ncbi:DUF2292 domain-containing protein [Streptococcus sp. S784/96/1]|uniref:DUF2292 domain-containing protein n=1 Tax=Streptococcus sp. S784/96/1 TaxID=2653499 RepID=UPI001389E02F|nr:DUF2292 domain-containing protein [Streptococcus sp. S784/96/1]